MWSLKHYMKPYWISALLAPLFMVFEVLFDLLLPKYTADLINKGVMENNFPFILSTGGKMIVVTLLGLICGVACNLFASRASQNFGADLRAALFKKVQALPFQKLAALKTGAVITRMTSDVVQVQNLTRMAMQTFVRAPGLLIGSIIMAALINLKLALILIGALILIVIVLFLSIRYTSKVFTKVQANLDSLNSKLQEFLGGIRVIRAFGRKDYESRHFSKTNDAYTKQAIAANRIAAFNSPVVNIIMNTGLVLILFLGGSYVWENTMQVGDLVALTNYITQALSSLLMISTVLVNVSQSSVSATRIKDLLSLSAASDQGNAELKQPIQRIAFEHTGFSYQHDRPILQDITFEARAGETVAIIGATGSGKSTLMQLIPQLFAASAGAIQIDRHNSKKLSLPSLRKRIGMVPQEAFLFSGTIKENIAFGKPNAAQEEIQAAAKLAQAHAFITALPDGYETSIGQRGVTLSGGQQQRISIARALLVNPDILILDDSTSALDMITEKRLRSALEADTKERITFLIAQKISSVMTTDKIVVMADGKVAGIGTHEELLQDCPAYQSIYSSQYAEPAEEYNNA